ncbi:MAG: flagellin, partial [Myxococcota bacterium]
MIATVLQLDFAAVRLSRRHEKTLLEATQRLSTGRRLNSAADAPASVGRVRRLEAQRRGVERGHRNVEESRSLLHLREGLLRQRLEIVQHLREMAVRSVHGTLSAAERAATEREADEYVASYGELANLRRFGRSVLDATTLEVSLGETGNSLQLTTENSDAETLIDFEYAGGLSTRRVNSGDIVINGIDIGDVVGSQATSGCTTCLRNPFALEGAIDAVASQTGVTAEVVRATTSARYVRYTIESTHSGTNELDISQLQIFDVDGFILNRSGWTATSSSTTWEASPVVLLEVAVHPLRLRMNPSTSKICSWLMSSSF